MKSKTKKESKRGETISYPAHYLAIALSLVIFFEGFMLGASTPQVVTNAFHVLDISASINQVVSDLGYVFEPMIKQAYYINEFYQLAATEITPMLDWSDSDLLMFPRSVLEFYDMATTEMAYLLDFSDQFENMPQVAGIAIFR